jgi:hypothetical protein
MCPDSLIAFLTSTHSEKQTMVPIDLETEVRYHPVSNNEMAMCRVKN